MKTNEPTPTNKSWAEGAKTTAHIALEQDNAMRTARDIQPARGESVFCKVQAVLGPLAESIPKTNLPPSALRALDALNS